MKLSEELSEQEKAEVKNESAVIHPFKIMGIIAMCVIALGVGKAYLGVGIVQRYGEGNPYYCGACRGLNYACRKHRGFSVEQEVNRLTVKYIKVYRSGDVSTEDSKVRLYDSLYNTECDYCTEGKVECSSCETSRNLIVDNVTTEVSTYTRCADCIEKEGLCEACQSNILSEILKSRHSSSK